MREYTLIMMNMIIEAETYSEHCQTFKMERLELGPLDKGTL